MCISTSIPSSPMVYTYARSSGKLCAFLSCITSIPRSARFRISAHVFIRCPSVSTRDSLKFRPFRLKAIVDTPRDVNQIPITGHAAKKKCRLLELLKLPYWNINLPK